MRASVILLTYNQLWEATIPCIESLYRYTEPGDFELIVVDNKSADGTEDFLRELQEHKGNIRLCLNVENKGFAGGNNEGLRLARGRHVVMVNNDTLFTPGWLPKLCNFLDCSPDVGLVSPITNYAGTEQKVELPGLTMENYVDVAEDYTRRHYGVFRDTERLSFFCVAMRRELLKKVGFLDEGFGTGMFEDDDYCIRVLKKKLRVTVLEDCFIYHQGSVSFQRLDAAKYLELFERNRAYLQKKHGVSWTYGKVAQGYLHRLRAEVMDFPKEAIAQYPQLERINVRMEDFFRLLLHMQNVENELVDQAIQARRKGPKIWLKAQIKNLLRTVRDYKKKMRFRLSFARRFGFSTAREYFGEPAWKRKDRTCVYPEQAMNVLADIKTVVYTDEPADTQPDMPEIPFSVIVTVRNEADSIVSFLDSLAGQSRQPDELVIVDGGSTDSTAAAVQEWSKTSPFPVHLSCPGELNISQGRNEAIRQARNEHVVLVDAGCVYDPDFCRLVMAGFARNSEADLVCGLTYPLEDTGTIWIATDYSKKDFSDHLPSARAAAIKKSLWEKAGEFPEYLTLTGEDTLFMVNYRRVSRCWAVVANARVFWNAPDDDEAGDKLMQRYGFGDGESGYAPYTFFYRPVKTALEAECQTEVGCELTYNLGVMEGRMNRPEVDARRGISTVAVFFAFFPFHYGKGKLYQLACKALAQGKRVVFVSRLRGKCPAPKMHADYDFTRLDLYFYDDLSLDALLQLYPPERYAYELHQDHDSWMYAQVRERLNSLG